MSKDIRDQFRRETKKEPIRLAHQTIPSVTTDYVKWLEEQLSTHAVSNAKRMLNDFIKYLEGYGGEFSVLQLQDYAEAWLKSLNDR